MSPTNQRLTRTRMVACTHAHARTQAPAVHAHAIGLCGRPTAFRLHPPTRPPSCMHAHAQVQAHKQAKAGGLLALWRSLPSCHVVPARMPTPMLVARSTTRALHSHSHLYLHLNLNLHVHVHLPRNTHVTPFQQHDRKRQETHETRNAKKHTSHATPRNTRAGKHTAHLSKHLTPGKRQHMHPPRNTP